MAAVSIRELVWDGKIPIRITVSEPAALGAHEYLLYARRVSYLPLYTSRVLDYFARYLEDASKEKKKEEWWFEYEGSPLPWNRPIGLLYDTLVGLPTGQPWSIDLKTGTYPNAQILALDSDDALLSYWTNQFKESCYIRDGNARAVMLMPREEQETLWNAILNSAASAGSSDEFRKYWGFTDPLIRKSTSTWNVPLRLYSSAFDQPVIQKLVEASETVGVFLNKTLPSLFPNDDGTAASAQPILHGAVVPLEAELGELYTETMYMDGFLHVSILST